MIMINQHSIRAALSSCAEVLRQGAGLDVASIRTQLQHLTAHCGGEEELRRGAFRLTALSTLLDADKFRGPCWQAICQEVNSIELCLEMEDAQATALSHHEKIVKQTL